MRILHVVRTVSPESGGVIEALLQLARAHTALGHPAEIVSLDPEGADFLDSCDLPLTAVGDPEAATYGKSAKIIPWLQQNHERYDAVISHGLWQFHNVATRKALAPIKKSFYIYPHGMLDPYFHKLYPAKYIKKLIYWKLKEAANLNQATGVLFTCEEECRLARNSFSPYNVQEFITGLGIKNPIVDKSKVKALFLDKYPLFEGRPFLLFLGRVHNKKGLDLLIHAFTRMKEEQSIEHKLAIVGPCADAKYYQSLKDMASRCPDIHFIEMLKGDMKWGAYVASEAMILPSHQENFGMVVAESLAVGTPVLISNKVNIWREIDKAHAGYVADDDLAGTEKLIAQWVGISAEEKQAMGERAVSCFIDNFEIEQSAQRLVDVLNNSLLNKIRVKP